jgi:hypothetical protein
MRRLSTVLATLSLIVSATLTTQPAVAANIQTASTQNVSITYVVKVQTVCTMALLNDNGVLLGSSTCGGNTAGFVLANGKIATAVILSTTQGAGRTATALQFFVFLSNNQFDAALFNGKNFATITGTVKIKVT